MPGCTLLSCGETSGCTEKKAMEAKKLLMFGCTFTLVWGLACTNHTLHVIHLTIDSSTSNHPAMVDYAFHLAMERPDILPGYRLESHATKIKGKNIGLSTKGFVENISRPPVKVAILGPFFTSQAKVIAATAKYYNIVQVGYSTTSPVLTSPELYPYFARTMQSTALHNPAIIRLLQIYNWRKVATIAQNSEYVLGARADLERRLAKNNVTTLASATYSHEPTTQVTQIKDSKAKIIISFTNSYGGMRPLCQAYKEGLYGARYQWFHWSQMFGLTRQFSDQQDISDGCTSEQVREAAEGLITFDPVKMTEEEKATIRSNSTLYTAKEIEDNYLKFLNESEKYRNEGKTRFWSVAFDATWSLVLGLNQSVGTLAETGAALEDFEYHKDNISRVMFDSLIQQKYYGPSGPVQFDANGDRMSKIVIKQVRGGELVSLGEYDPIRDSIDWYPDQGIRFQGPRAPYDWDITVYKEVAIDMKLSILMITLAFAGLVYCLACVVVAFKYRSLKLIKLSSPRINSLIALGCGLSYLDILFFGLDSLGVERKTWMCGLRVWLLLAGFTLAFGSMFSKTWRVHVLFTNKKLQRKIVKDLHLLTFVLVILLVDILVLVIWQVVDPLHWTVHYPETEIDTSEPGKIVQPLMYMCSSKYISYWSGILYAFKGLLLIFGMFFAWETRKVRIEALNDSKLIGISVYNVMIMSVVSVPLVSLLSPEQASIKFGITSISVLVCATLTMTLVYATKIYLIFTHGSKADELAGVQLPFQSTLRRQTSVYPSQTEASQAANAGAEMASGVETQSPGVGLSVAPADTGTLKGDVNRLTVKCIAKD